MNGAMKEKKKKEEEKKKRKKKKEEEKKRKKEGPFSIEEVLAKEVHIIHGKTLAAKANSQEAQEKRKNLNKDERGLTDRGGADVKPRHQFYIALNELNRAALCCSGGGIRSATFCLGVIQALAKYDVDKEVPPEKAAAAPATGPETTAPAPSKAAQSKHESKEAVEAKNSLLGRFHFLSTVSGGGYVGSWLSSWRSRQDFATIIRDLTSRPNGPDIEPPEISWLRAYSNYLTPQLGITSADSWAAIAICVRNLILNWLVIIPVVCLALLGLKLIATISVWIAHGGGDQYWLPCIILAAGVIFLIVAQAFTTCYRPSRRSDGDGVNEAQFFKRDLVWAVLSAMAVTIFLSSHYFSQLVTGCADPRDLKWIGLGLRFELPLVTAVAGFFIYLFGWIARYLVALIPQTSSNSNQVGSSPNSNPAESPPKSEQTAPAATSKQDGSDFAQWAASGLVYGAAVGVGAYLFALLVPYTRYCQPTSNISHLLLPVILGVPWILMAQLVAEIIFVGLTSYERGSDADREWLGRSAGWLAAAAVVWALTAFLVFAGGYFVQSPVLPALTHKIIVALGGVAGVVSSIATALLGSSSKTAAKSSSDDQGGVKAVAYNVGLAVAGPVFVAVLIVALSVALDKMLLNDSLVRILQNGGMAGLSTALIWLSVGVLVVVIVGGLASHFVNINRFSLHALYRNRLIRAYLGASNEDRKPDLFTGFDFEDNIRVHELWPPMSGSVNSHSLFHVINIALNVVSTKRLAWQERKAESFTVSPLHCGSAYLGFRSSQQYGDGPVTEEAKRQVREGKRKFGIALGTAVAISGAAVSPNSGYHSSPLIALLLTLFNVRLGWWLGNPGKAGKDTYREDGPKWAAEPLFAEALGFTTDSRSYVYLSDGGHFENLGLYEMVRRRCRLIVLIDAGCDPDFAFEDLGNAVRKIYIDLGIRITFKGLEGLKNHPSGKFFSRAVRDAAALMSVRAAKAAAQAGEAGSKAGEAGSKADEMLEPGEIPYYAIGTIDYQDADHTKADDPSESIENGTILYIKPAYHGTETSADIRSYATANPDFPHESTAEQWFTESQFESYRSLGLDIGSRVLHEDAVKKILRSFLKPARDQAARAG